MPGPCVLTCLLLVLFVVSPAVGAEGDFDWREIRPEHLLSPAPPFTSSSYEWVRSETDSIEIRFTWPAGLEADPGSAARMRCVIVAPSGGIESATYTSGEVVYLSGGDRVTPANSPAESFPGVRLTYQSLGEYRGAQLSVVEFRPILPLTGVPEVQHSWIPSATITVRLKEPFHPLRRVHEVVERAFSAFVLNAEEMGRCLPPPPDSFKAEYEGTDWSRRAMRVRTRGSGWHAIPARRVLSDYRAGMTIEQLRLGRRGPAFTIPEEFVQPNDQVHATDRPEAFGVVDASGEWKASGPLSPEDRILFHAEESAAPFDPLECYWLSVASADSAPADVLRSLSGSVEDSAPVVRSGWSAYAVGEDRVFVDGGLKTESQVWFWVDRMFPGPATGAVRFSLPPQVKESVENGTGSFSLVLGSGLKDRYSPGYRIRPNDVSLFIDGATVPVRFQKGVSPYATEFRFELPDAISSTTGEIVHAPSGKASNPLYLDEVRFSLHRPLIWAGSSEVYTWPSPTAGRFEIQLRSPERLAAVVKGVSGEWSVARVNVEGETAVLAPGGAIVELHLFSSDRAAAPLSISRYDPPPWVVRPIQEPKLLVGPEAFRQEGELLIEESRADGTAAAWVDVQSLFDLFTGGQFSPHAVRRFLSWAARAWPDPAPASVLVVGDSSWDAWGRFPHSREIPNWTPSYHTEERPDYPSDLWFVEGVRQDRVGDWFWGRIPCQTNVQLQTYIAKLREFRRIVRDEPLDRLLWVTDDNPPFAANKQKVYRESLPLGLEPRVIDVRDHPFVDNFYYTVHLARIQQEARETFDPLDYGKISPPANRAIREAISAGPSMFVYYGHSGLNVLGHERLLFGGGSQFSDVPSLSNGGRAPLALLMTCDVGRFDFAETPKWSVGLAEEMLFHGPGGCLALVTSTGRGLPDDHLELMRGFMDALFNRGVREAGAALWAAKTLCLVPGRANEAVDMFTLLGDPLFRCSTPGEDAAVPTRFRWLEDGGVEIGLRRSEAEGARYWASDEQLASPAYRESATDESGEVVVRIADAEDAETVYVGWVGGGRSGGAAVNLAGFERPDWSAPRSESPPDLSVSPEGVEFENPQPRVGETLFLTVAVANNGGSTAENVRVQGYKSPSESAAVSIDAASELEPFAQFAKYPDPVIRRIRPGETRTIRLRWDRWEGAGVEGVLIRVDPEDAVEESDETNNSVYRSVRILNKPDLAWGVVRDSTAGAVDFSRARIVDAGWITQPESAQLGGFAPLRGVLGSVDRAVIVPVPLTNFGESLSDPCAVQYVYRKADGTDLAAPFAYDIPAIPPSVETLSPRAIPVLLVPGMREVELRVDPDGEVDEAETGNNRIRIVVPSRFWDRFPSLAPRRVPPKALERIELE